MSEKKSRTVLQEIASAGIPPETIDLWPRVRNGLDEIKAYRPAHTSGLSMKVALPVFLIIVAMIVSLLVVGPERALAALRGLLGYVPGVGLVDEGGGLRVLAEPVSLVRDGITVVVEQAVLDSQQTVLIFSVDGIPPEARPEDVIEQPRSGEVLVGPPVCSSPPYLSISDSEVLPIKHGGSKGWASGYQSRIVFPAIPPEVQEAVFIIPCLQDTSPGAAPENWRLGLRFVPASPDLTVMPVIEISETRSDNVLQTEAPGAGLSLEKVIELEDSYILAGTFHQGAAFPGARVMGISRWPEIVDANGQLLPFTTPSDLDLATEEKGVFPWAYEVKKGFDAPLTIVLEAVDVEYPVEAYFQFDSGHDPQVGQEWELHQEFDLAGHRVELVSAVRLENAYSFSFKSDDAVFAISIEDPDRMPVGGFGGGQKGNFNAGIEYADPVPSGQLQYHISGLMVSQRGPWTINWEPPEGSTPVSTETSQQICLTLESLQREMEKERSFPEGLSGKMIAYGRIYEDDESLSPSNAGIFTVNLADGSRRILGPGTWPSLSADGTHAAYSGADGLHIVDLASGENVVLPGTTDYDYNPRWSPDGSQLAFVRINDLNLYVVNVDGSSMRRVTEGPEYELLIDWLSDGQSLAYVFPAAMGLQLRFMNLTTGEQLDGFGIDSKGANVSISPDDKQIAFLERVEGGMDYGLYVASLDGSNRRLIVQLSRWSLSDPRWSPDGNWLSLGISNPEEYGSETVTVAIHPTTCEIVLFDGIMGYVQDWSK